MILDVNLPDGSGLELLTNIESDSELAPRGEGYMNYIPRPVLMYQNESVMPATSGDSFDEPFVLTIIVRLFYKISSSVRISNPSFFPLSLMVSPSDVVRMRPSSTSATAREMYTVPPGALASSRTDVFTVSPTAV